MRYVEVTSARLGPCINKQVFSSKCYAIPIFNKINPQ